MKVEITEITAAVTLTVDQFRRHFLDYNDALEFLEKKCPNVEEFNWDGHFGPYIFFRVEGRKYERTKDCVLKAIQQWMAGNSNR